MRPKTNPKPNPNRNPTLTLTLILTLTLTRWRGVCVLEGWSEAVRCALHLQHESAPHAKQPGHRRSAAEGKHAAVEDGQAAQRCEGCGGVLRGCGGALRGCSAE